jgi:hypothetical protein
MRYFSPVPDRGQERAPSPRRSAAGQSNYFEFGGRNPPNCRSATTAGFNSQPGAQASPLRIQNILNRSDETQRAADPIERSPHSQVGELI